MRHRLNFLPALLLFLALTSFDIYSGKHGKILTRQYEGNTISFFLRDPDTTVVTGKDGTQAIQVVQTEAYPIQLNGAAIRFNADDTGSAYPAPVKEKLHQLHIQVNEVLKSDLGQLQNGHFFIADILLVIDQKGKIGFMDFHGFNIQQFSDGGAPLTDEQKSKLDAIVLSVIRNTAFPVVQGAPYQLDMEWGFEIRNGIVSDITAYKW